MPVEQYSSEVIIGMMVGGTLESPPLLPQDYLSTYLFYWFISRHEIWFGEDIWWLKIKLL